MIGYLNKWKQGRIPLMLAFFIDLLEIPSILSKCFQDEKIDPVCAMQCLNKADERFELFAQKKFEKLPHVKDLLKRVVEKDGEFFYQDVKLPGFEIAKNSLKNQKAFFTDKIRDLIKERLEREEDSKDVFTIAPNVLNTEAWIRYKDEDGESVRDLEFIDDGIEQIIKHFRIPLTHAGFNSSVPDVLSQWHDLLGYSIEYLSLSNTPYRETWRCIFASPRSQAWKDVLLIIELLFTIPVSNAKLERMFSKMKHVKTLLRASLSEMKLESILRINEEGPDFLEYDPMSAIKLWVSENRRPNQEKRKSYKPRESKKRKFSSLSDSDTASEEDNNEETDITLFDDNDE